MNSRVYLSSCKSQIIYYLKISALKVFELGTPEFPVQCVEHLAVRIPGIPGIPPKNWPFVLPFLPPDLKNLLKDGITLVCCIIHNNILVEKIFLLSKQ